MGELIGEFKGKNSVFRVLPDGRMEVSGQGAGKILGMDAMMIFTAVADTMQGGVFVGDETAVITTMEGDNVIMKSRAISWPSGKGGTTRGASTQTAQSQKLARLNKVIGITEFETDENNNWVGKIWEWK